MFHRVSSLTCVSYQSKAMGTSFYGQKICIPTGTELSCDIYIRPPPEANCKDALWKLKRCVYDLADASLYWYNRVREIVLQAGGKVSHVDPAVFYWTDQDCEVNGVLACLVDDFIWGGAPQIFQHCNTTPQICFTSWT